MKHRERPQPLSRRGFTLVELLVAMGLTMFVMTILVEAFGAGMDTFSALRSLGDMQDNLRAGLTSLKSDLSQDHFEGGRRMSDVGFWDEPRREGFMHILQKTAPSATVGAAYFKEGQDADGLDSLRATDHVLHFSVRRRGNRRESLFYDKFSAEVATIYGQRFNGPGVGPESMFGTDESYKGASAQPQLGSPWAEVGYFLEQSGQVPDNPTVKLHRLYRAQFVVVPYVDKINGQIAFNANNLKQVSRSVTADGAGKFLFYSPNDLARPKLAGNYLRAFNSAAPDKTKAGLVLSNVISFQVQILKDQPAAGKVFEDLGLGANVPLDTADSNPGFRVMALKITLRIYDPASGLTRQATLIQDM